MDKRYETIKWELKEGIGIITISRPEKLNALNRQVLVELEDLIMNHIKDNVEVKVVILTGEGDKSFVAGADIETMSEMNSREGLKFSDHGHKVLNLIENLEQPVIAAVNGYALGGGCELALACDIIYASENAKFGQPEVKLGIIPGFGGTQRLVRAVGPIKAKELIFTGKMISAQEAKEIGLVADLFSQGELMEKVKEVAKAIIQNGLIAVSQAKRVINYGKEAPLSTALEVEKQAFSALFDTEDQKEGMKAFLEKRKPNFKNR